MASYAAIIDGGTRHQRELIEDAFESALSIVVPDRACWGLIAARILLEPMFYDGMIDCEIDDDTGIATDFHISLNSRLDDEKLLRAFAHEMIHLGQYFSGRLKDDGPKHSIWCGKRYRCRGRNDPWEREAYFKEWGIVNHLRLRKVLEVA